MTHIATFRIMKLLAFISILVSGVFAQQTASPLPTLREQARIQQEWLRIRLERVLPKVMRDNKVQMWIVPMREYNEDPVFSSFVSATAFSARRRTIFVFNDLGPDKGIERLIIGSWSQGGLFTVYRDTTLLKNSEPLTDTQWQLLTKVVRERDPKTIAVNISQTHAFSDGMSVNEWERLQEALGPVYTKRVVRAERLALDYIAIRIPEMLPVYRELMKSAHAIIAEAFSDRVITPGKTTTQDVVWWMREKLQELNLETWFQPSVDIQRRGADLSSERDPIIQKGDVLHCDFGVVGMRLHTDTQHLAYVLKDGETDVPAGIKRALANSNRLQDLSLQNIKVGLTGNEVLARTLQEMRAEGINGTVYSHAVGEHGHGAGSLVGMYDQQMGVPGRGDVPLLPNTWYSIELQATTSVPEWENQQVSSEQEEDAEIDENGQVRWILDRQTQFYLVH